MPVIELNSAKLTKEQKVQLVAELTEVVSRIVEVHPNKIIVLLKENKFENIGIGGVPLSQDLSRE